MFLIYVNDIPNIITSTVMLTISKSIDKLGSVIRSLKGFSGRHAEDLVRRYVLLRDSYIEARSDRFMNDSLFNKYK